MALELDRAERAMAGTVVPLGIALLGVVPWLLLWGDLPDPMAIHFDVHGAANGSAGLAVYAVISMATSVGAAAALARWVRHPHLGSGANLAATASFIGALMSVIAVDLTVANRGHHDWHDVRSGLWSTFWDLAAASVITLPVVLIARRLVATEPPVPPGASLPLGSTERVAWFGRARSVGFAIAAAAEVVVGVLCIAIAGLVYVGVTLLVVGVVLGAFTSVIVTVSEAGVRVRSGVLHWPGLTIPLADVEQAAVIDVRPLQWGGWGYRGSLRVAHRAAWVLHRGPGLELQLTRGRRFAVTVDGAADAAAVVNGLVSRRG